MNFKLLREIPKAYCFFGIFIFAFVGLFSFVEITHHKFETNDFRVYYYATLDYFKVNNPYFKNYGLFTGFFKYPPFTLYLFKLFTFFGYGISQLIHLFLLTSSLVISISFLKIEVQKSFQFEFTKKQSWILYVTFISTAIHLVREFHMGNINLYLLGLFVLGLKFIKNENSFRTAFFWSLMLILKPIMILAVIPLVFYKKWKTIAYMSCFGIFFFLFPIISEGWNGNLILWGNWVKSVTNHGEYIVSKNSLTYLSNFYFGIKSEWIPSLFCLVLVLTLLLFRLKKKGATDTDLQIWSIVLTAFTPNFFVTDTEHFLLVIPLLVYLLFLLSKSKPRILWIGFFIGFLLFSINSNDLFGRELSNKFDVWGVLGIGNAVFIVTFLLVYLLPKKPFVLS